MNKSNVTIPGKKGMSKLVRPRFGPGMLLQHEDLELLNDYTRELNRLMFGSLFGCGVICGLIVTPEPKCGKICVTVGCGLAFACSVGPIHVPTDQTFSLSDDCPPDLDSPVWVVLCGTTKCCSPRPSLCETDDDETKQECTREREGFEIRIVSERQGCLCGCPEPRRAEGEPERVPTEGENVPGLLLLGSQRTTPDCKCAPFDSECYKDHYAGLCGCHCDCNDCDCKCVLLARLDRDGDTDNWIADHSVRRFIRPVLMRDPQVEIELAQKQAKNQAKKGPEPEDKKMEETLAADIAGADQTASKATKKAAKKKVDAVPVQ